MHINKDKETTASDTISVEEKVAFLQQPCNYPYPADKIETKETHMSWVFLAGDFVYKLKKPVKYSFLDHHSLESRFNNSREEIRINKQLAENIYIGIVPVVINGEGALQLEGKGEVVDWLVKMKRIPEENMLDYVIKHDCADDASLYQAATLLAGFYKSSPPVLVTLPEYTGKLESEISFNYNRLMAPLYELPLTLIKELNAGQIAFLSAQQSLFEKRIKDRRIIDAHGDLRPEHICLAPRAAIIDRLEFSKALRIMDIAEELSFLSMECEMMGNTHTGRLFMDVYKKSANDNIPRPLINFYKIKKACLRAYLVARHIEETRYKDDPKWLVKANAYLHLAENYHQQLAT